MLKKIKIKSIFPSVLVCGSFLFLFLGVQRLVMPKYVDSVVEGRLIAEYYGNEQNNQVLFLGDCEVYENFSPITLWETQGFTSYIRGGPQQLIWQSYYLLEDTLLYETPDVVVFNVLSMKYNTPQSEPYNRLNLDGMQWSEAKIKSIFASMTEDEDFFSYLFPLFRYHERIVELTQEDFSAYFGTETLSHNGYLMHTGVKGVTVIPQGDFLANSDFGETSYAYLDKINSLCKENEIELVLIKAPTIFPFWYEEWDLQMVTYAEENQLLYLNFLDLAEEIGIDFTKDTYDGGLHLNVYGAEKLTSYFGAILKEEFELSDGREDGYLSAIWSEKREKYLLQRNSEETEKVD